MLICRVCTKVIANVDPNTIRYGVCATCPIPPKPMTADEAADYLKNGDEESTGLLDAISSDND